MDWKVFATVFATIFLAELGDKTQLATLLYAADSRAPRITVFLAASAALIATSAIGVAAGGVISRYLNEKYLSWIAGAGFIAVGVWTIARS